MTRKRENLQSTDHWVYKIFTTLKTTTLAFEKGKKPHPENYELWPQN
jgi:hypothetical protein